MKFYKYLNEEDAIKKGLEVDEPEVSKKYNKEYIQKRIDILQIALKDIKKQKNSEANDAIIADITDKIDKWKNVDKETKPAGPSVPAEILVGIEGEELGEEKPEEE